MSNPFDEMFAESHKGGKAVWEDDYEDEDDVDSVDYDSMDDKDDV